MGWQRWLYAKEEPSPVVRAGTAVVGCLIILTGIFLFYYGAMFVRGGPAGYLLGGIILFVSLPFFAAGLTVLVISVMRWTNPRIAPARF